jgi:hypothetical protein
MLIRKITDEIGLRCNLLHIGASGFATVCVIPLEMSSRVITMNGKSEGRTQVAQRVMP